jgi:hypothetical protein
MGAGTGGLSTARPSDYADLLKRASAICLLPRWVFFFQHMIYGAHVYDVGRRNLMLILAAEMAQPDIDGFVKGKFRFGRGQSKLRYQEP